MIKRLSTKLLENEANCTSCQADHYRFGFQWDIRLCWNSMNTAESPLHTVIMKYQTTTPTSWNRSATLLDSRRRAGPTRVFHLVSTPSARNGLIEFECLGCIIGLIDSEAVEIAPLERARKMTMIQKTLALIEQVLTEIWPLEVWTSRLCRHLPWSDESLLAVNWCIPWQWLSHYWHRQ